MKRKQLFAFSFAVVVFAFVLASCDKDTTSGTTNNLTLSQYSAKVEIGEILSLDVNLANPSGIEKIDVKKSQEGKPLDGYSFQIPVAGTSFPYKFNQEIVAEDVNGVTVYSFYAKNASGNDVDAADFVMEVALAQIPLLVKYDWKLVTQIIKGEDLATEDLTDDIHRFNPDLTWEVDWGTVYSAAQLETLKSYCAWQPVMNGSVVDSLYTVSYNVFSPSKPSITRYKVLQLSDRTLKLESHQNLSAFGDYSTDEIVVETYEAISKTDDFTPYRNQIPENYYIEACDPGSYK